nr:MAG TPA: portal protein [Caudoviricetes sp.]
MDQEAVQNSENGAQLLEKGNKWLQRISSAETREDDWRKDAEAAEKTYACDPKAKNGKLYDFNILHSNVETIVPAIYNSTPVPDVRPRFVTAIGPAPQPPAPPQQPQGPGAPDQQQQPPQPDPQAIAQYQQQIQAWQQKVTQDQAAKDFCMMIERVITVLIDDSRLDTEVESEAQDSFLSGRGIIRLSFDATFKAKPAEEQDQPGVDGQQSEEVPSNETIDFQAWSWRDFRMGKAKRWKDVPWVAFLHHMPREALDEFKDASLVQSQAIPTADNLDDDDDDICIWEVWDKASRRVWFIDGNTGAVQKIEDDPLELPGFFPTPPIIQPITLTGKMTPVCPFTVYKKLADELDLCTKRIAAIMKGLKVRGGVAGNASNIQNIAQAGDNELVTISDLEQLVQTGGLEKAIVWWPIEKAIAVLQQLYLQRDVIKSAIYEITGISDIVRGASNANETLGAQQIKTQWGSLRIQKMQRMIERQVRDVFAMMADIIVTKFSPATLQEMTGIEITPGVMALMNGPVSSSFRIDVESDSTVKADLTRVKGEMSEFLQGTAQFFSTMAPVIGQAPQMAEPVAEIYASFARAFRLGKQAEDAIDRISQAAKDAANQDKPDPAQEANKAKMDLEAKKLEMEFMKAKAEFEIKQVELQIKQQELALKDKQITLDGQVAAAELQQQANQNQQMPLAV